MKKPYRTPQGTADPFCSETQLPEGDVSPAPLAEVAPLHPRGAALGRLQHQIIDLGVLVKTALKGRFRGFIGAFPALNFILKPENPKRPGPSQSGRSLNSFPGIDTFPSIKTWECATLATESITPSKDFVKART